MDDITLLAALRRYEYNNAIFDEKAHDGLTLRIAHYEGAFLTAMRAMLRERAYDVCEMSPSSYVIARQAGAPIIGLPIFPFQQYALGQLVVRDDAPLTGVQDLKSARIAVRTWAQPTALWVRHYLMDYCGVDLSDVQWVFTTDDPVPGLRRPDRAVERRGATLDGLLAAGEVDAAIGLHEVPQGCRRLISDPMGAASQWTRDTDVVPANHLIVMDARHLDSSAPRRLCERFHEVLTDYIASDATDAGVISELRQINPGRPPLPSGRKANARMWETLIASMLRQGMIAPVAQPMDLLYDWEPAQG